MGSVWVRRHTSLSVAAHRKSTPLTKTETGLISVYGRDNSLLHINRYGIA
jgi:hypothetical protein